MNQRADAFALARLAQHKMLDADAKHKLVFIAKRYYNFDTFQTDGNVEIAKGLATQDPLPAEPVRAARKIRRALADTAQDSVRRTLEIGVAVQQILALPLPARRTICQELRLLWLHEPEPEVRVALGNVLIQYKSPETVPRLTRPDKSDD